MTALFARTSIGISGPEIKHATWLSRTWHGLALIALLSIVLLGGCSTHGQSARKEAPDSSATAEVNPPEVSSADLSAQPSFSAALNMYRPLGRVEGQDPTIPFKPTDASDRFSEAIAYAQSMQSFSFLVWHKGELLHEQYFEPFDSELRPESASMHKSVLALLVGVAIDDGYIASVEDPVSAYLPEWQNDGRGEITLSQLLQMNSGLKPLSFEGGIQSEAMLFNMGEDVRNTILGRDLVHQPGTVFHYSSVSSQLLGLIIERATGAPYAQYLSKRLWKPLGAEAAFVWHTEPDGFPHTHTALMAKAQDWLRVGLLIKDNGVSEGKQIVAPDYIERMLTPSPTNPNYGFQIWLGNEYHPVRYYNEAKLGLSVAASEPFAVDGLVYLDGFGGQRVYISKSLDLVIVRTGEVRMDWDDAKIPNLGAKALDDR